MTNVPGPGNYNPNMKLVEEPTTRAFSFTGRSGSAEPPKRGKSPGPGNYNAEASTMTKHGPVFGNEKRPGVEIKPLVKNPGPGAYNSPLVPRTSSPKYKYCET